MMHIDRLRGLHFSKFVSFMEYFEKCIRIYIYAFIRIYFHMRVYLCRVQI